MSNNLKFTVSFSLLLWVESPLFSTLFSSRVLMTSFTPHQETVQHREADVYVGMVVEPPFCVNFPVVGTRLWTSSGPCVISAFPLSILFLFGVDNLKSKILKTVGVIWLHETERHTIAFAECWYFWVASSQVEWRARGKKGLSQSGSLKGNLHRSLGEPVPI